MKRLTFILFMMLIPGIAVMAQAKAGGIKFISQEHNYGKIKEEAGFQTARFEFTNTGNDTVRITSVKPSCGCITCNWTRNPIPPAGGGFIEAVLNPIGRPGPLSKGIEVFTDEPGQERITLIVRAEIEAKQRTIADDYPFLIGSIRFSASQVAFQNMFNTAKKTDTLKMYNEWTKPMTFLFDKLPEYITCKAVPENLKPQQKGYLLITYDAGKRNDFGFLYDRFMITTNDTNQPDKQIAVSVNITEDFSKMTPEQLSKAPKIEFENTTMDFGTVGEGDKAEVKFKFTNTGKSELIIRKVKGG